MDGVLRIHVGRRDDAHVNRDLLAPAEAAENPLLQHAQQLHLRGGHHLGDLVEEERAAVRQLEDARAAIGGAGERPFLVAEDLALEERLGNRGAVDRDKRKRRPRAELVDRLRDELLAGARLPRNQHRGARRRGLLDHPIHRTDAGAVADDPAEASLLAELTPQCPHFAQRVLPLDRLLQKDLQPLRIDRLAQIVVRAVLDRFDRAVDGTLRGQKNEA